MTADVTIRSGDADDLPVFQRVVYEALGWNPDEEIPPIEVVLAHPEAGRYHEGWGRHGDLGVVAEVDGEPIGGAYCRLFTEEDHGHGFIDAQTPEVAIAVWGGHRGQGVGGQLLDALEELARSTGFWHLSLSVATGNPAARLYRRHGYTTLTDDDGSYRMVKQIAS